MTHRVRPRSRVARLIALVAIVGVLLPASAAAADTIDLEAHALVAGRFEAGGWVAVSVSLANDGAPVTGYLAADGEDGTVRRLVELPAGSRKQVNLYLRPASFTRTLSLRFETADATQLASGTVDVQVLERTATHVAVVGDGTGTLRPQLIARAAAGLPEPIAMTAADLPERPEPLRGIETIVWAGDSASVTEAQRRSLERWIAAGGQLVVIGGPDWQSRVAAFTDLLPVDGIAAVDDAPSDPLAAWAGADVPAGAERLTVATGQLRSGAVDLVTTEDGVLFAAITRGAGRVTWLGVDLATQPFRAWPGASLLWARVVPDDRALTQFGGGGPLEEELASLMTQALSNLPALEVPPAELLLAVLVGYILLIGPVSYLVLRRLDRRELAWVTAPILVLVFSAGTYGIGASMKGSDIIVNEVAVVRSTTGGSAASVSTYAGVFSPARATYDLAVEAEALFAGLQNPFDGGSGTTPTYATEQGTPSRLRGLSVGVFSLQAIRAETLIDYRPSLELAWSFGTGSVSGTVTNVGETAIADVAVVSQGGGTMVGSLEPGASKTFTLSTRNLNGSSASDQVYGFVTYDPSSAEQRQVLMRRQVIDALVGYGGGWPGRVGEATGGIDRGPFVIGWRADASPTPIEIEGHTVQRFSQAVEVLAGRPLLGPGPVTLDPSLLTTTLVSTAGEVSDSEPGYVVLGNGEAVFQVSLPLEAAHLEPSRVTLVAGSDPSMIFFNQGNFTALLPSGYRISMYDNLEAAWVDVGDLSVRSRFEIDDPARAIDRAGRILVRISGSDLPDGVGQNPVFAGASVEGAI
jgi:hypothetical protein